VLIIKFPVIFKPITTAIWCRWQHYCGCISWFCCSPQFKTTGYE